MLKNRTTLVLVFLVLVSGCLCALSLGLWYRANFVNTAFEATAAPTEAALSTVPAEAGPDQPSESTTTPGAPEATEEATASTPAAGGEADIDPSVLAAMDRIQDQVIALRGLQPAGTFSRSIYSPEDLRERVINDFFSDYSPAEAADDARTLAIFGLIPADYDLISLYTELFSEQVAGFYDDDTQEMVVVGSEHFGGPEKLTYAHEYQHALQDQNYGFDEGLNYNDDACEEDTERCAAIQALVEGDASLTELHWFLEYSTDTDRQEIFDYYDDLDSQVFDTAPAFLQRDFIFPYDEGFTFVQYLFDQGGWPAVDAAFLDVPVSTEQILHPEKYPSDRPAEVTLPDLLPVLGDGWELLDDNVMGEWYLYLILAHGFEASWRIDDGQAEEAAAGWGGDRYHAYYNRETGERAMVMRLVWDSPADQDEFAEAFRAYGDARFGQSQGGGNLLWEDGDLVHLFAVTGDALVWIAAPSADLAGAILAHLP